MSVKIRQVMLGQKRLSLTIRHVIWSQKGLSVTKRHKMWGQWGLSVTIRQVMSDQYGQSVTKRHVILGNKDCLLNKKCYLWLITTVRNNTTSYMRQYVLPVTIIQLKRSNKETILQ